MSTWWRPCRVCGESGDDVRRCPHCGAFAPFGSQRTTSDESIAVGCAVLAGVLVVAIIALGLVVLRVTGGM